MTHDENKTPPTLAGSAQLDLEALGLSEVAYLRRATVDNVDGYSIHAANGVAIGFAPAEHAAIAAIMTNDLELALVH